MTVVRSLSSPSIFTASAALARPGPMAAASSAPDGGRSNWRRLPSGSVTEIMVRWADSCGGRISRASPRPVKPAGPRAKAGPSRLGLRQELQEDLDHGRGGGGPVVAPTGDRAGLGRECLALGGRELESLPDRLGQRAAVPRRDEPRHAPVAGLLAQERAVI